MARLQQAWPGPATGPEVRAHHGVHSSGNLAQLPEEETVRILRERARLLGRGAPGRKDRIIQSLPITVPVKSAASTFGIRSAIGASHGTEAYSFRIRCASETTTGLLGTLKQRDWPPAQRALDALLLQPARGVPASSMTSFPAVRGTSSAPRG
ncbi:hypothetical protein ACFWWM_42305 [Streptomyces sp. NPDC058682]|uniref:hypothetical protein n=1 Tax=Streptomyces sp. NPDC058682 TaxID=3346596 RepID=UPI00365A043C